MGALKVSVRFIPVAAESREILPPLDSNKLSDPVGLKVNEPAFVVKLMVVILRFTPFKLTASPVPELKIAVSPEAGTPERFQLEAVPQSLVVPTQVFVAAWDVDVIAARDAAKATPSIDEETFPSSRLPGRKKRKWRAEILLIDALLLVGEDTTDWRDFVGSK